MTLPRPVYVCVWLDSYGEQGGSRFFAADDSSAVDLAGRMAELSGCKLEEFWKFQQLGPITTHAPASGSNIQDKTWFHYKTSLGGRVKVSLPAIDRTLLELDRRKTDHDRITGATAIVSKNGTSIASFVKGINNYGLRKRDKTG